MDSNAIALITLNPGNVGWFDPITNIHLTIGAPEAYVMKNMNTKNIKKAIKACIIRVLWGDLSNSTAKTVSAPKATAVKTAAPTAETIQATAIETAKVQDVAANKTSETKKSKKKTNKEE